MKPLDLREYAMNLYNRGNSAEMELAKEMLDLIIWAETSRHDEICESLDNYAKGCGEPLKQVEWLGDRSNLLAEIEETLAAAGRKPTGTDDVNDMVKLLLDTIADKDAALEMALAPAVEGLKYDL